MVVMKPFMSDEGLLKTGDIIDGSKFRNTRNLVNARYLQPLANALPEAPAPGSKDPVIAKVAEPVEEVVAVEKPKRRTKKKTDAE